MRRCDLMVKRSMAKVDKPTHPVRVRQLQEDHAMYTATILVISSTYEK